MQVDDAASFYVAAAGNEKLDLEKLGLFPLPFVNGKEYNSKDLYDMLFIPENNLQHVIKDLKIISTQQCDDMHPSLYYSILRIWEIFIPDTNYMTLLQWGCFLNLIFFFFAFFYMYKLLNLLFDDKFIIFAGMVFSFANTSVVAVSTMVREYFLQYTLFIVVTYIFVKLFQKSSDERISIKEILGYSIGISFYLLSGYFALVSAGIYFGILFIKNLRNAKVLMSYILIFLLVVCLIALLCPNYLLYLYVAFKYNSSLKAHAALSFSFYIKDCICHLEKYLFYTPVFLSVLITFPLSLITKVKSFRFNKNILLSVLLVVIGFVCIILESKYTIYRMARYIIPLFPIISMLYLLLILCQKRIVQVFITVIFILLTINRVQAGYFDYDKYAISEYPKFVKNMPVVFNEKFYDSLAFIFINSENNNTLVYEQHISEPLNYRYPKYYLSTSGVINGDNVTLYKPSYECNIYFVNNTKNKGDR